MKLFWTKVGEPQMFAYVAGFASLIFISVIVIKHIVKKRYIKNNQSV